GHFACRLLGAALAGQGLDELIDPCPGRVNGRLELRPAFLAQQALAYGSQDRHQQVQRVHQPAHEGPGHAGQGALQPEKDPLLLLDPGSERGVDADQAAGLEALDAMADTLADEPGDDGAESPANHVPGDDGLPLLGEDRDPVAAAVARDDAAGLEALEPLLGPAERVAEEPLAQPTEPVFGEPGANRLVDPATEGTPEQIGRAHV